MKCLKELNSECEKWSWPLFNLRLLKYRIIVGYYWLSQSSCSVCIQKWCQNNIIIIIIIGRSRHQTIIAQSHLLQRNHMLTSSMSLKSGWYVHRVIRLQKQHTKPWTMLLQRVGEDCLLISSSTSQNWRPAYFAFVLLAYIKCGQICLL